MRSSPVVILAVYTAATSASSLASTTSNCPLLDNTSAPDLAKYISCVDDLAIQTCLTTSSSHPSKLDVLVLCLRANGCEGTESLLSLCQTQDTELRRRQLLDPKPNADTDTTAASATPTAKVTKSDNTVKASTSDTKATTNPTTKADTKTTASQTTLAATTAAPTTKSETTLSTSASSATSPTHYTTFAPDPSALTCLATTMVSTSFCGIITQAGSRTTLPCIPTETPSTFCAPGLLCQTQAAGVTSCMVRQDSLTTSGLIVTIVFGSALFTCFALLIFFIFRSRSARKHQQRMLLAKAARSIEESGHRDAEAPNAYDIAAIGGGRGRRVPAKTEEASLPLMTQQGPAGGLQTGYGGREPRTLRKERPGTDHEVSPIDDGEDIGYRRKG